MNYITAFFNALNKNRAALLLFSSSPFSIIFMLMTLQYLTNTSWDSFAIIALAIQTAGSMTLGILLFLFLETIYLGIFYRKDFVSRIRLLKKFFGYGDEEGGKQDAK